MFRSRRNAPVLLALCATLLGARGALASSADNADGSQPPPADVKIVKGLLPKDVIAGVVRGHQKEIRACYERELSHNHALQGRIVVDFVIDGQGDVTSASVHETTLNDAWLENCVLDVVRGFKFPPPAGAGTVHATYPWTFKSTG